MSRRLAPIDIVPFAKSHQDGVIDVILPIQREEFAIAITLGEQPDLLDIPGFYQRGAGNFWVALCAGDVVGTIALLDLGNAQGALRKMFVKAPFRGDVAGEATSVARRLLDTLLASSAQRSVREVYLGTTAKYLAAHRFYEKNGFVEIAKSELPSTFPVMAVDTQFYRRG